MKVSQRKTKKKSNKFQAKDKIEDGMNRIKKKMRKKKKVTIQLKGLKEQETDHTCKLFIIN